MLDKKWDTPSGPLIYLETLKGLCHDTTHVWALTVADCFWILGSEQDERKEIYIIQDSLFAKRESFLFDFIYPHNSNLFSGIPQMYFAADKNKINNPVLLWNKHLPTRIFTYPR